MPKPFTIALLALSLGLLADSHPGFAAPPEVEALIKQLSDKDDVVRLKAAKELGKLKEKAKDAIPTLKMVAASDSDEDVRAVAKKALDTIKEATDKVDAAKIDEKLGPLIKDMRSKDNKVRLAAIAKLEELGADAKPAGAALVEFGMMSPNPAVKDAANAAFERIDPLVHKEIITVYYDVDIEKKDAAVRSLELMGAKAKAAVPIIKGYHHFLVTKNKYTPGHTLTALVKIAPEDKGVQTVILALVGGPDSALPYDGRRPGREFVVNLMNELKIEDKQKLAPLVSGIAQGGSRFDGSGRELMIAELGKLRVENKEKYPALMAALSKNTKERALIINEIAKLGADAKAALPVLQKLKTDSEEAVRIAANAAIEAIK